MARGAVTAAGVISFVERLEDHSEMLYAELAEIFPGHSEMLLGFVRGSQKNKRSIVRAYRETISDALETNFAFGDLELAKYAPGESDVAGEGLAEALEAAIAVESRAIAFYTEVAEQSRSLLATIPIAFRSVARNRSRRREHLKEVLHEVSEGSP